MLCDTQKPAKSWKKYRLEYIFPQQTMQTDIWHNIMKIQVIMIQIQRINEQYHQQDALQIHIELEDASILEWGC